MSRKVASTLHVPSAAPPKDKRFSNPRATRGSWPLAGICLILARLAFAADEKPPLVARVDDESITRSEAEAELRRVMRGQEVLPETLPGLQAAVVQQLVNQRLVLRQLAEIKRVASDADIDQSLARLKAVLETRDEKLDDYLAKEKITAGDLRQQFRWQLSWEKYLAERCTPDNLQKFFEKHRPHFDGRERKAAHILFKVDTAADAKAREEIRQQAAAIQADIVAKKISFATAAEKHSQGPSAKSGGDIGFIRRHEPMPEAFSKAIFDLPAGECSPPIATSFGWHLVQWAEEKAGKKTWQDAEAELKPAIAVYLFEYHAAQEMKKSPRIERLEW